MPEEEVERLIIRDVFMRMWNSEVPEDLEVAVLRDRVRYALASSQRYRGRMLVEMPGLPSQDSNAPLRKWIDRKEDKGVLSPRNTPSQFYAQVKTLLTRHLGVDEAEAGRLIVRDIFRRLWNSEIPEDLVSASLRDRIRFGLAASTEYRGQLAIDLGGRLPKQTNNSPLRKWVDSPEDRVSFATINTPKSFYGNVEILLVDYLGIEATEAEQLIVQDIFERMWNSEAPKDLERTSLLDRLRYAVASSDFRGKLPKDLPGFPVQGVNSALQRFIDGKKVRMNESLLSQIETLFKILESN